MIHYIVLLQALKKLCNLSTKFSKEAYKVYYLEVC